MQAGRFFFAWQLTDRSSDGSGQSDLAGLSRHPSAFSPGNFFADILDRTVIY